MFKKILVPSSLLLLVLFCPSPLHAALNQGVDLEIKHNFEKDVGKAWIDATDEEKNAYIGIFQKRQAEIRKKEEAIKRLEVQEKNARAKKKELAEKRKTDRAKREYRNQMQKEREERERRKRLERSMNDMKNAMQRAHRR